MSIKDGVAGTAGCLWSALTLVWGLAQLAAGSQQIEAAWGWHIFPAGMLQGALLIFVGPIGSVVSFFGAKDVWHWDWWLALFFAAPYFVLWCIVIASSGVAALFGRR